MSEEYLTGGDSVLLYEDAASAVEYLTRTFGFVQRVAQTGAAGRMHIELLPGDDGLVMLGQAGESFKSPMRLETHPSVLVISTLMTSTSPVIVFVQAAGTERVPAGVSVSEAEPQARWTSVRPAGGKPMPFRSADDSAMPAHRQVARAGAQRPESPLSTGA